MSINEYNTYKLCHEHQKDYYHYNYYYYDHYHDNDY
jgi:hypothetical protein